MWNEFIEGQLLDNGFTLPFRSNECECGFSRCWNLTGCIVLYLDILYSMCIGLDYPISRAVDEARHVVVAAATQDEVFAHELPAVELHNKQRGKPRLNN